MVFGVKIGYGVVKCAHRALAAGLGRVQCPFLRTREGLCLPLGHARRQLRSQRFARNPPHLPDVSDRGPHAFRQACSDDLTTGHEGDVDAEVLRIEVVEYLSRSLRVIELRREKLRVETQERVGLPRGDAGALERLRREEAFRGGGDVVVPLASLVAPPRVHVQGEEGLRRNPPRRAGEVRVLAVTGPQQPRLAAGLNLVVPVLLRPRGRVAGQRLVHLPLFGVGDAVVVLARLRVLLRVVRLVLLLHPLAALAVVRQDHLPVLRYLRVLLESGVVTRLRVGLVVLRVLVVLRPCGGVYHNVGSWLGRRGRRTRPEEGHFAGGELGGWHCGATTPNKFTCGDARRCPRTRTRAPRSAGGWWPSCGSSSARSRRRRWSRRPSACRRRCRTPGAPSRA